jgi:hypothetical protein
VKSEGAAVTGLNYVLHLLGEDRRITALVNLTRTQAGSRAAANFSRIFSAASGEDGISTPERVRPNRSR